MSVPYTDHNCDWRHTILGGRQISKKQLRNCKKGLKIRKEGIHNKKKWSNKGKKKKKVIAQSRGQIPVRLKKEATNMQVRVKKRRVPKEEKLHCSATPQKAFKG
jgi:hypothetical protein